MRRAAPALGLVLAACAAPPVGALPASADDGFVAVDFEFEPPLPAPGRLVVQHESGARVEVETGRAGARLRLPPGPASLRLAFGGRVVERPLLVRSGVAVVVRW